MKKAIILHGTGGNHTANWFPWLQEQLEQSDYKVWTPDLPQADKPNIQRYNQFILSNQDFDLGEETILVGHSSGAVAILGLLEALPRDKKVDVCYLIGSFRNDLNWDALNELFLRPFDFDVIKTKARKFVFIHSDNDPYCPLDHAQYLSEKLGGELLVKEGQQHFSIGTAGEKYAQFPFLLELIGKYATE